MSLSRKYKTNGQLETNGFSFVAGVNDDGTLPTFTLRRQSRNNKAYQSVIDRVMEPHRAALSADALPDELYLSLLREAFAEGVIVGWQHVLLSDVVGEDNDGFAPYSKDNAIALLKNLPDLYAELQVAANTRANYQDASVKADAKN